MALKTLALCIVDGDLEWSFTEDFSMMCALADKDENEVRVKICKEIQRGMKNGMYGHGWFGCVGEQGIH